MKRWRSAWVLGAFAVTLVPLEVRGADPAQSAGEPTRPAEEGSAPAYDPAIVEPLPPPLAPRRRFKWGAEFRVEAAPIGGDSARNAGMGGFGMSLRPRPSPWFAVDIGADFFFGRDYYGDRRREQSLLVTPMLFVNPRQRVTAYFLGGVGLSAARAEHADGSVSRYGYLGVNGGFGVEAIGPRGLALDVDLVGFVRGHTDEETNHRPEFVDSRTGRQTNTSAGVVVRVGAAYYW